MAIVLGGTGDVGGGFGNLGEIYARSAQRPRAAIVNMNPGGGGGGGGGSVGAVTDRDVFAQQAQQAAAVQHAELQQWLSQQDMTQREQMRLQQDQNAIGAINEAVAAGKITQAEGDQAATGIRTRVDVGRLRLQGMQQRHQQMVNDQMQHAAAQQAVIDNENSRFHAAGFPNSQSYSIDPQGEQEVRDELSQWTRPGEQLNDRDVLIEAQRRGYVTRYHQHRPGQWEAAQREGGGTTEGTSRSDQTPVRGAMTREQWTKHLLDIEKHVNEEKRLEGPEHNQERRDKINELARDAGLMHPDDMRPGQDVRPTYNSHLETLDPSRRQRRLEGERVAGSIRQDAGGLRQQIEGSGLDRDYQGTLRGLVDRMEQAGLKYQGRQMPAIVRARLNDFRSMIDDALRRQRELRTDQQAGQGPPPAAEGSAPAPLPPPIQRRMRAPMVGFESSLGG